MVPNMRRVVLSCDRLGSKLQTTYDDSVCSSLCQGVDQISVDASCGGFPFALSTDYLPGITRIKKCNGINGDEAIGLVQDEIVHATVYPLGFNIYHCFFRFSGLSYTQSGTSCTLSKPQVLCTSKRFYHYDDILLKGNFGTLEYLSLSLSPDLVRNLEERRTFTNSHPRLRHLQLYNRYNSSHYASNDAATCFALKIISSAQTSLSTLELHSCFNVSAFIAGVRSDTWPSRIQSLSMPEIHLDFSDMVQLLKNLPALKTLHSNIGKPKVDKILTLLMDAYFSDPTFSYERAVLLVALICPYFGIATLNYRDWSQEDTQLLIESEEFRQHADRLRQVKFCVDCDI
ncbi:hypothetical protein BX661DRAFT_183749 [Kickxella alabastrina]|uniref:uncharacterized protein n=1 Tax=Kickxella alabastrina TaxID=61397 RepID=UPI00221F74FD|nr:uncharacterized protein BX661DRAFT_183749 [Kickxella alabastrina]KAI7826290.1 hypothetical protein BX661DRAFT_183749 [Kickxella alabastrina]